LRRIVPGKMSARRGGGGEQETSEEMKNVIMREQQKVLFNELVSRLTDKCFDKCVTSPSSRLSSSESTCLTQCALRFLDSSKVVMERLNSGR